MSTDGPRETGQALQNERLLTLEFSDEVDLFGGEVRNRIFLRLYAVAMGEFGLFRALPDPLFKLPWVQASYANVEGWNSSFSN